MAIRFTVARKFNRFIYHTETDMIKKINYCLMGLLSMGIFASVTVHAAPSFSKAELERGRYLVRIGGCNDCHTPGYPESGGQVPESDWLTGSQVAFQGPWGASYPSNLRLVVQSMSEAKWLAHARTKRLPPMPWFNLAAMSDKDLKAMYRFIHSLGAKGQPAPEAVPPGQALNTPYIEFFPKNMPPIIHAVR